MLMSLSLSQKLDEKTGTRARLALAFGITDETFVVSSLHSGILKASYMLGLILRADSGVESWNLAGRRSRRFCRRRCRDAMGIALYAMFIALILPAARGNRGRCAASSFWQL